MQLQRKIVNRIPILGSSSNNEKISLAIKGTLLAIVALLATFGVDIQGLGLNTLVEAILRIIELSLQLGSSVMVVYGISRKIYYKFKK